VAGFKSASHNSRFSVGHVSISSFPHSRIVKPKLDLFALLVGENYDKILLPTAQAKIKEMSLHNLGQSSIKAERRARE
jgi:hypothetical protein